MLTWGLLSRIQFAHFSNGSSDKTAKAAFRGRQSLHFPLGEHWAENWAQVI